jgi:peroxiredoxin
VTLTATDGGAVDLSALPGRTVIYVYPMTGQPGTDMPAGWDEIPGARGCTPQSCSFRDHYAELKALGVDQVFGLSTQDSAYQKEAAERLHLPFALLSDADLHLTNALKLPTFIAEGAGGVMTLIKRLSLIIEDGKITHCLYPVFPPDQNAQAVIDYLKA